MTTITTKNAVGWSAVSFWDDLKRRANGEPELGSIEINEGESDE